MAAPTESAPTIAGIGHVYVADPDTTPPAGFLDSFKFDTGS
ncbi:MAG: putative observed 21.5Kd protein, partial [Actinomyces urogenitalis DORA_12]